MQPSCWQSSQSSQSPGNLHPVGPVAVSSSSSSPGSSQSPAIATPRSKVVLSTPSSVAEVHLHDDHAAARTSPGMPEFVSGMPASKVIVPFVQRLAGTLDVLDYKADPDPSNTDSFLCPLRINFGPFLGEVYLGRGETEQAAKDAAAEAFRNTGKALEAAWNLPTPRRQLKQQQRYRNAKSGKTFSGRETGPRAFSSQDATCDSEPEAAKALMACTADMRGRPECERKSKLARLE
ncbi:unnamed protein product [Symbiodinium natans]|uniref:Uncharacterized protein n=1 Tax=Symbiodinium natans TaxID=878477 RepID=A0A812JG23_9DINO|nr:unnamed protein product [Symbiodinium natans]